MDVPLGILTVSIGSLVLNRINFDKDPSVHSSDLDVLQEFKGWSTIFDDLDALLRQIANLD